jgi:hypothetical protein
MLALKRSTTATETETPDDEFAGMTAVDCCHACVMDPAKAAAAQKRLNELEAAYPRQQVSNRSVGPVVEMDGEWLRRNPNIAEEYRLLSAERDGGKCYISGDVCAHPLKCGLHASRMQDAESLGRFARAKNRLAHQKLDLLGSRTL